MGIYITYCANFIEIAAIVPQIQISDWVLSHWMHFTVHSLDFFCVYLCVFCAFVFHTA